MTDMIRSNAEASIWARDELAKWSGSPIYGEIATAVIWTAHGGVDGSQIVPITAENLVRKVEEGGMPLLRNHDPGLPSGRVVTAKAFIGADGKAFVAALLGFYSDTGAVSFTSLGIDINSQISPPKALPPLLDDFEIQYCVDPRDVSDDWSESIMRSCPFPIVKREASYNSLEAAIELILFNLPFVALVWNPYVTAVASAAGRATYEGAHKWLRQTLQKMEERKNPVLAVTSYQGGCEVQFLFRGSEVKKNYQAHDSISFAGAQAAQLIARMVSTNTAPARLIYEFDEAAGRWFPSYAILYDGRFVSNQNILIALEQLPKSLSLGIMKEEA